MKKILKYTSADNILRDPKMAKALTKRLGLVQETAQVLTGARIRMGFTQVALAKKINSTQSVIARVESGRFPTRLSLIDRIAGAYKTHARIVFDSMPEIVPVAVGFIKTIEEGRGQIRETLDLSDGCKIKPVIIATSSDSSRLTQTSIIRDTLTI